MSAKERNEEPQPEPCVSCGTLPLTPLVCDGCGHLLEPKAKPTPFQALGMPLCYALDERALHQRLLRLSRALHPDFFSTADPETRARAQRNSAELNAAHRVLQDDFRRADWLVRELGGPSESEERQMPQEFLLEVMEWNEVIEEAREQRTPELARRLADLERELRAARQTEMRAVGAGLDPVPACGAPELTQVRRHLNAVRYIDRTLREIAELELDHASP